MMMPLMIVDSLYYHLEHMQMMDLDFSIMVMTLFIGRQQKGKMVLSML
jgi:hypothetical protein